MSGEVQGSPESQDLTWTRPHFNEHYKKKSKNEISSREFFQ